METEDSLSMLRATLANATCKCHCGNPPQHRPITQTTLTVEINNEQNNEPSPEKYVYLQVGKIKG